MAQTDYATAILVDFDRNLDQLRLRSIGKDPYVRFDLKLHISGQRLDAECLKYWKFVDDAIGHGQLTLQGADALTAFYDELITAGVRLCNSIFDADARRKLWALARQSTVITLITDLMNVPWEALFDTDSRSFLSDHCVIVRWPEVTGAGDRAPAELNFDRDRVVCLDPIIASDAQLKVDGLSIREFLESHFGADLVLTKWKHELVERTRSVRVIQWICEHATEGLRLDETIFYSCDDCEAHPFAGGSILILTSCKSGAPKGTLTSVASAICVGSHCTVIAPSSVVATSFGVRFAMTLDKTVRRRSGNMTVAEFWRQILVTNQEIRTDPRKLTPKLCFARWYGIYGNGQATIN